MTEEEKQKKQDNNQYLKSLEEELFLLRDRESLRDEARYRQELLIYLAKISDALEKIADNLKKK